MLLSGLRETSKSTGTAPATTTGRRETRAAATATRLKAATAVKDCQGKYYSAFLTFFIKEARSVSTECTKRISQCMGKKELISNRFLNFDLQNISDKRDIPLSNLQLYKL